MKRKNVWRPDTCGCVIVYEWDDTVPQEERVSVAVDSALTSDGNVIYTSRCPAHTQHILKEDLYREALEENISKNHAIGFLIESIPQLKDRAGEIKWRINIDRGVTIILPDDVKGQKSFLESTIDKNKFKKNVSFE